MRVRESLPGQRTRPSYRISSTSVQNWFRGKIVISRCARTTSSAAPAALPCKISTACSVSRREWGWRELFKPICNLQCFLNLMSCEIFIVAEPLRENHCKLRIAIDRDLPTSMAVRTASFFPYLWMLAGCFFFAVMGMLAHAAGNRCEWQVVALLCSLLVVVLVWRRCTCLRNKTRFLEAANPLDAAALPAASVWWELSDGLLIFRFRRF